MMGHAMNDTPPPTTPRSVTTTTRRANCETPGSGTFCGQCGQRLDVHLHSVGHFVSEAAEVLTHSDSTLWRTLWPLLARPGHLTREFIAGRRVRYLQPFRLYLVASVLLLIAASFEGGHADKKAAAAASPPTTAAPAAAGGNAAGPRASDGDSDDADADARDEAVAALKEVRKDVVVDAPGDCHHVTSDAAWMKPFLPALQRVCRSANADNGRELVHALVRNAGRAMFVFLPLLAAFMKLLYWRPRRYYLEHLLLLLHNHAFVYLAFALLALATFVLPSGWIAGLLVTATLLYSLRYLYKSMRVYYGQGRLLTVSKFMLLGLAYCVAGAATFAIAALVTVVTL